MLKTRLLRGWLRVSGWLPLPVAHAMGVCLGALLHYVARRTGTVMEDNIALCFPEMDAAARSALVRRSWREFGKQLLETGIIWYASPGRLRRLVVNPEVMEEIAAQWPRDRGLLIGVPHLGNWELCNLYLNQHHPVHHLYRPPREPWLEPILVDMRERTGARSLPADTRGLRFLLTALRQQQLVGILPDQLPEQGGVHAPFFGHPALTMTLFGQMARKTGAAVVFLFSERLPRGQGFRLHLLPADDQISAADPQVAAAALNRGVEACVRLAPAQYQWTYRRFQHQPPGMKSPYRKRSRRS